MKTIVYAKFGGANKILIMGKSKILNRKELERPQILFLVYFV